MLCAPAAGSDTFAEAVPPAGAKVPVSTAAVPASVPVPMIFPPAIKLTVPVGAAPLLCVAIVAVSVIGWPMGIEAALLVAVVVVGAIVMLTASAGEVLAVKLLSPE
jgi:hypothetical protein